MGGEVFEIHGNLDYMRCRNECTQDLYPSNLPREPDLSSVPTCPNCGDICRPHILCFDESYNEEYFRARTAAHIFESIDVLIILGTQLKTNLSKRLVQKAQANKVLIYEGNIKPVLEYG